VFAEEFIFKDGIQRLVSIIAYAVGNTQAYALTALRSTMVYVSGMEQLVEEPELIHQLYDLLAAEKRQNLTVQRNTLELLFIFCNYTTSAFALINNAAFHKANESNKPPYEDLISLLTSGDLDTQMNTLTLLNSLLNTATPPEIAKDLLGLWKNQGIANRVQALADNPNPKIKAQVQVFQHLSGIVFVEADARYAVRVLQLEEALKGFQEQQPLVKILRAEFVKARLLLQEAAEQGFLVNPCQLPTCEITFSHTLQLKKTSFVPLFFADAPLLSYEQATGGDQEAPLAPIDLTKAIDSQSTQSGARGSQPEGKGRSASGILKAFGQKSSAVVSKVTKSLVPEEDTKARSSSLLTPLFNQQDPGKVAKVGTPQTQPSPGTSTNRMSTLFGRGVSRDDSSSRSEIERLEKLLEEERYRSNKLLLELNSLSEDGVFGRSFFFLLLSQIHFFFFF